MQFGLGFGSSSDHYGYKLTIMACDPNTLMAEARCLEACIPPQMLQAVQVSLLCQIAGAGSGGGGGGEFVLKAGDTMTGELSIDLGTESVGPGTALEL